MTTEVEFVAGELEKLNKKFEQEWEIWWEQPYAPWIEDGTLPHPVSAEGIRQISKWAHRKLGLKKKDADSLAEKIAWRIRRKGSKAQPFVRPAIDALQNDLGRFVSKYGDEGPRVFCEAIVARANEYLEQHGTEDTGALGSQVSIRRLK